HVRRSLHPRTAPAPKRYVRTAAASRSRCRSSAARRRWSWSLRKWRKSDEKSGRGIRHRSDPRYLMLEFATREARPGPLAPQTAKEADVEWQRRLPVT